MPDFFPKTLDSNQGKIIPRLDFLNAYGFYLAGGTALSLQIGHRSSVDFDFFTPKHFDSDNLYGKLLEIFEDDVKKTGEEKGTLLVKISGVDVSFFWYKYPLIERLNNYRGANLASIKDIAAMKLLTITARPAKRDYIDIYYLLNKFNLEDLFSFANKKYPNFNDYLALRALTYFEDITKTEGKRPIRVLDNKFDWEEAKLVLIKKVKEFQLSMFKK